MGEIVSVKIINLIHDITQLGFEVKFCPDFRDMVRIEYYDELDKYFYEHAHLGCPDTEHTLLERQITESLEGFLKAHRKSDETK